MACFLRVLVMKPASSLKQAAKKLYLLLSGLFCLFYGGVAYNSWVAGMTAMPDMGFGLANTVLPQIAPQFFVAPTFDLTKDGFVKAVEVFIFYIVTLLLILPPVLVSNKRTVGLYALAFFSSVSLMLTSEFFGTRVTSVSVLSMYVLCYAIVCEIPIFYRSGTWKDSILFVFVFCCYSFQWNKFIFVQRNRMRFECTMVQRFKRQFFDRQQMNGMLKMTF